MDNSVYLNNFSSMFNKAMLVSVEAHKSQFYDNDKPYIFHLTNVSGVLQRFGYLMDTEDILSRQLHVAAFLHDILEDTEVKYRDLLKEFGFDVAEMVYCVTDELGRNRHERHVKTYPKIKANPNAMILKLADRIANIEYSKATKSSMLEMYRKEYKGFKEGIYTEGVNDAMWNHLENILGINI